MHLHQILNFQNTFVRACDEFRLEIQSEKFRWKSNLNKITGWGTIIAIYLQVYQLLAHGRWFSPGTPASSTTNTGRHDIAEILLKVALKHQKSKSKSLFREYVRQK
jgi:hypothetical protein